MLRYLIIGNAIAATGCIEGIRAHDADGEIIAVGEESRPAYARPLISYLLEGKAKLAHMGYRPEDFYERQRVQTLCSTRATRIDPQVHTVALDDGRALPYDRLMLTTGSRPILPAIPGLESVKSRHTFYTLDDALALQSSLTADSRVLIVGAGLIGLKCAEGVHGRAGRIAVADRAEQILPSVLDAGAAARMQAHLEKHGIDFFLGATVTGFDKGIAALSTGAEIPFDILVLAVGVMPETTLARQAGIAVDRGLLVDESGRTSLPDIFAAGDCAQGPDMLLGTRRVLALLPNAYQQAYAAGATMAGHDQAFGTALSMNAIGLLGLHALTAGIYEGETYEAVSDAQYKKLFLRDDRLVGFILVGDVDRAGIYTALIRDRVPLSGIDFELIAARPQLMAFSRAQRAQKMGGVPV